jgi:hypothetical protein
MPFFYPNLFVTAQVRNRSLSVASMDAVCAARNVLLTRDAMDKGYIGADRWIEHHEKLSRRLVQMVAIFDDPIVPDGALVKLRYGGHYSHLGRAIKEKLLRDTLEAPDRRLGHLLEIEGK